MRALKIQIAKFIDNHQPGFVECKFYDAFGKVHIVQEKVPVVTSEDLNELSIYPQEGIIACEIINEQISKTGERIFKINTSKPWGIETVDGISEFHVLDEQLIEYK